MFCTCHAGEGAGAESVGEALHVCGATRIGHGTRVGEDAGTPGGEWSRSRSRWRCASLRICTTHTVETLVAHPARKYLAQGARVTLNTDGRLMDGVTLTDEYHTAHTALGFTKAELERVVLNGAESAFLPDYERVALVARIQSDLEAL